MSKLLSKLDKISKGSPAPLGFGAANREEKVPAMVLVGRLSQNYAQGAARLAKVQVDGALLEGEGLDGKLKDIVGALGKVPWGIAPRDLDDKQAGALLEEGCDFFLVESEQAKVEAMKADDGAAYLLSLPEDPGEAYLRAIDCLPVDAVLMSMNSLEPPLTLQHLITIGSVRTMLDKYLMLEVPTNLSSKEIEGLRDLGVDALVVDAGRSSEKVLAGLKEKLLGLPRQRKSRSERMSPILPSVSTAGASARDDDDEDEEY